MASESMLRQSTYIRRGGCNVFKEGKSDSLPLSIWTEDDIWAYIRKYDVPIADIYHKGAGRTGCMACGYGCTRKGDNRFNLLYELYPKVYQMCMSYSNNGFTYRQALNAVGVILPDQELMFRKFTNNGNSKELKPVEEKDDNLRSVKSIIQENIDKKIGRDSKESISANRLRNNQKL